MEINLTQIFIQGLGQGVGAGFAAVFSLIAVRYFPKFMDAAEKFIKATVKEAKSAPIKEADREHKLS